MRRTFVVKLGRKLEVENLPLAQVIPYARNAVDHPPDQVRQLAASIKEFGFTQPVLIDQEGVLIAGHGRTLAAELLGLEEVPCIRLAHLSPEQVKALRIADNRLQRSSVWNIELLELEVREIAAAGTVDVEILGFEDAELSGMLREVAEIEMPSLNDGDREPFQQMAFKLHDDQVEGVKRAIDLAHQMGPYDQDLNKNRNANAIARICEVFVTKYGKR